MASRGWTCRRVRCGVLNEPLKRKCVGCGSPKPKKRVPAHRQALRDVTYFDYLDINNNIHGRDEVCAVCGRGRGEARRLDRDHDHTSGAPHSGQPRGLVCASCNMRMRDTQLTPEMARLIAAYLTRVEEFYAEEAA